MALYVALAAAWALLLSGLASLARPGRLRQALRSHDVLGPRARTIVARLLPGAEALLGGALLVAFTVGAAGAWHALTALGSVVFVGYAGYLSVLVWHGVDGDCGCGPSPDTPSYYAVVRGGVMAVGLAASSIVGLSAGAALVALVGQPLLLSGAATGAVLSLVAHGGWASSDREMAAFARELSWEIQT